MEGSGMWIFRARALPILSGALLLCLCSQPPAFARGSQVGHDDPWNSEHIDRLPPEVRDAVIRMCGNPPRAGHYFATYFDHAHVIKLHFEHLHCEQGLPFCKGADCLHQEYISTGGHYRLIKNYYDRSND
jgi:hypothetical protein